MTPSVAAADVLAAVDDHPPPPPLSLRAIALPDDLGFLLDLYGDSRAAEMARLPWPDEHKRAFLASQFAAQHADYQARFAHRRFWLVTRRGRPVGRLSVAATAPGMMRIIDISVAAGSQGTGIGTALLRWLMHCCTTAGAGLDLHVRRDNRAGALYARLGFVLVEAGEPYDFMRLAPPGEVS